VVTLSTGTNSVATDGGNDTVNVTATTLTAADTIDGGTHTTGDTLAITGGGTLNLAALTNVTGFELVTIDNTATNFTANNDGLAITAGNGGNTIVLGNGLQSVTAGTGADSVALGAGQNTVNTGGGSDTVTGTLTANDTVDLNDDNDTFTYQALADGGMIVNGGNGSDTLVVTGNTPLTIDFATDTNDNITGETGSYRNFENLSAGTATGAFTVTAAAAGSTITTGSAADTVALGASTDTLVLNAGNDTVTGSLSAGDNIDFGADDDTFTYSATITSTNVIDGGAGGDTLIFNLAATNLTIDFTATNDQIALETGFYRNFDHLQAGSATGNITVTDGAGASTIITGSGSDVFVVSGANSQNAGDYFDAGSAGDVIQVSGGTVSMLVGTWLGFEQATLLASATFIANATASFAITGSSGADDITMGATTQTVSAGSGNDIIRISATSGMPTTTNGGGDTDTLVISGGGTYVMSGGGVIGIEIVDMGTTAATLTLNNRGYQVNVEGGVNHSINSGDNSLGDDVFIFSGPAGDWVANSVAINGFLQGSGNDIINLTALLRSGYNGESATSAGVDALLAVNGVVFDQELEQLKVDLNGDGAYITADDLTVNMAGVTDLTVGVDLFV
jgi:hypothetical protein